MRFNGNQNPNLKIFLLKLNCDYFDDECVFCMFVCVFFSILEKWFSLLNCLCCLLKTKIFLNAKHYSYSFHYFLYCFSSLIRHYILYVEKSSFHDQFFDLKPSRLIINFSVIQTKLYSFKLDCSIVSLTAAKTKRIFSVSERY